MSKASNNKNIFLKQRLAKLQKKSAKPKAEGGSVGASSRHKSRATAAPDRTVSKTPVEHARSIPDDAMAEELIPSDSRGNPLNPLKSERFSRGGWRDRDERPAINEMVREATAGGVIYRVTKKGDLEILLVADHFDRWTIPKGHIEEGETAQETAIREIGEEAGVHELEPICWLGKIHFRYRRGNTLVLMSTQIYLFRALGDTDNIKKEDWMNGIKWFKFDEAVDIIAYEDIAKLMLLARNRLRQKGDIE
jgi:ADP-ribose pyrophosphatase YjhB (NUDIX family)